MAIYVIYLIPCQRGHLHVLVYQLCPVHGKHLVALGTISME
jgi:hypothetical protein